jgi:hypothetical protein
MMTLGLPKKAPSYPDIRYLRIRGACLLLVAALLAGCSIKTRTGHDPNISALETKLVPGESTRQQVSGALGWPYGEGRALMPFHDKPRDVVTYYYEEGTLDDDRRIFLFVFLNEDAYEGYMWFSSLEKK